MVPSMELVILLLIRSFGEANFFLYCQLLAELISYFFANNNVSYAQWIPIHYRDMLPLEQKHPQLAQEFQSGNFVVHESSRQLPAVAMGQAHEQVHAVIKSNEGAIGVTEDQSALRRWMIAAPEVTWLHSMRQHEGTEHTTSHHEETGRAQRVFLEKVEKMQDMGMFGACFRLISSTAEGVDDSRFDSEVDAIRNHSSNPSSAEATREACCLRQLETQAPANWGWTKKGDLWLIVWTELPSIAESC
ncbi:unnamed protein product [Acanthosepion pharaonis]|uniref:Uncharacterized protein n=1 Tax=Acanthosepion pharaonis TaxID=158019 RepID=A0A812EXX7_ACAPH|nr:unnamed protein product [Sepia pharaonis]